MMRRKADFLRALCSRVHKPGGKKMLTNKKCKRPLSYKNYQSNDDGDDNDNEDEDVNLSGFIIWTLAALARLETIGQTD